MADRMVLRSFARLISAAVGLTGEHCSSGPRSHFSLAPPRPNAVEIVEADGTVYGTTKSIVIDLYSLLAFSFSFSFLGSGDGGKEDIMSKAWPVTCVRVFVRV